MEWIEFCTLLAGIMPKTPLGNIVSIRAEEDRNVLKGFTKEQHRIRDSWRTRHNPVHKMSESEKKEAVNSIQEMMAKAFG